MLLQVAKHFHQRLLILWREPIASIFQVSYDLGKVRPFSFPLCCDLNDQSLHNSSAFSELLSS